MIVETLLFKSLFVATDQSTMSSTPGQNGFGGITGTVESSSSVQPMDLSDDSKVSGAPGPAAAASATGAHTAQPEDGHLDELNRLSFVRLEQEGKVEHGMWVLVYDAGRQWHIAEAHETVCGRFFGSGYSDDPNDDDETALDHMEWVDAMVRNGGQPYVGRVGFPEDCGFEDEDMNDHDYDDDEYYENLTVDGAGVAAQDEFSRAPAGAAGSGAAAAASSTGPQ